MRHRYLCSLGSNIEPHTHLARAVMALLELAPRLSLSRVIRTQPAGMDSDRAFLNALVCLECSLERSQLKAMLNAIEIASGRDRDAPDSARRDRTLDIDILAVNRWQMHAIAQQEPYLAPLADDFVVAAESLPSGVRISLPGGVSAGQRPATIDRDPATGDVRIVEQVVDGFADGLQTALNA